MVVGAPLAARDDSAVDQTPPPPTPAPPDVATGRAGRQARRRWGALLLLGAVLLTGAAAGEGLLLALGPLDAARWAALALWALVGIGALWPRRSPLLLLAGTGVAAPLSEQVIQGTSAHLGLTSPLLTLAALAVATARMPHRQGTRPSDLGLSRALPASLGSGLLRQELERALGTVPYLTLVRLAPEDRALGDAAWLAVVRAVLEWKGLRPADYVGVTDQRELAVLLLSVDLRTAESTLIRLVQRVDQLTGVAVRVGVAAYPDLGSNAEALWDEAGRQLEVAHATGAPIVSAAAVEDDEGAVERLADSVDLRLFGEPGHARTVAELAARVAQRLGLGRAEVAAIRDAAYVRDIGHLGTPDALLHRPGPLSARQRAMVRAHVQRSLDFLTRFPRYQRCLPLVRAHHERPDGTGYPDGLVGGAVPVGAAIIAAADAYRAMVSPRPHRSAYTSAQARAELRAGRGTAWSAEVVDALLVTLRSEPQPVEAPQPTPRPIVDPSPA